MKRYAEYKDSGIEWIGDIPNSWDVTPIRALCYLGRGRVISNEEIANNVGEYPVYSSQTAENGVMGNLKTYDFDGEYVTWTTDGANAGTVFYRQGKFNCTNVCGTLRAKSNKIFLKYLPYVLNLGTKCYVRYDINPKLMNNEMAGIRISLPSFDEQQNIANYLNQKTTQIDVLINKKERMIDLLKEERAAIINQAVTKGLDPKAEMKDSGIDWLGQIPKHWKIGKVRFSFFVASGNGFSDELQGRSEGDYPFYKVSDINSSEITICQANNYVSRDDIVNNRWNIVFQGSILLAKIGAALAKNHRKISEIDCLIDNNMMAVTPSNSQGHVKYFYYLMCVIRMEWFSNPGAVPSVDINRFRSFIIPDIEIEEQKEIAGYLDHKIAKVDEQVDREHRSIELLKEYRTALISEVVTGKIDVRN